MYIVKQYNESNSVEIINSAQGVYARIYLNYGGSLQQLSLKGHQILANLEPLGYETTYASAVLFPFANRVKDGRYSFDKSEYQLDINHIKEHNAIHGMIYNKNFHITHKTAEIDSAEIILEYDSLGDDIGFPFPFNIRLCYSFKHDGINLEVLVNNRGHSAFPFTIGWHPYFSSHDLTKSMLKFSSTQKTINTARNIAVGLENVEPIRGLSLDHTSLDDCWGLDSPQVTYITPHYVLGINSTEAQSFLQVYTPPVANAVAIEPTTGVSNSLNNEIGLRVLQPNEDYSITWKLQLLEH